jgi:hypothetical protein
LNNLIFKLSFNPLGGIDNQVNFTQKNEILPLYILYSKDNFDDIGDPKVFSEKGADPLNLWEDTYNSLLRNDNENEENENGNDKKILIKELKEKYLESRLDEELLIFE